jgi:ribosome-associated translation inhibitor RaiA
MKLSITFKNLDSHDSAESPVARCVKKLERLLQSYEPDLVQLHGVFSRMPRKEEYSFSLTLYLPSGTLHAVGTGEDIRASCKQAFHEIEAQMKKRQALLRKDYEWKRKSRPRARMAEAS